MAVKKTRSAWPCWRCGGDGTHKKTCPDNCPSGKVRFLNEASAQMAVVKAKIKRSLRRVAHRREERAYACPMCRGWHLTSKPLREAS